MKLLNRVGGSFAMLYLVCVMFVVTAVGYSPAGIAEQVHGNSTAQVVKVDDVAALLAANKIGAKVEPVAEQSVIGEVADTIPDWIEILTTLITLAGVITAATPSPRDNVVLGVVRRVFDIFALNVGNAKNQTAGDRTFNHLR